MSRIETREKVFEFIFQTQFRDDPYESYLMLYRQMNPEVDEDKEYFLGTVSGILDNREDIDNLFAKYLRKWTVDRIPKVDRVILEIAAYEIKYRDDIPTSVSINEAVKLAKKFGDEKASSYINGVLSSLEKSSEA